MTLGVSGHGEPHDRARYRLRSPVSRLTVAGPHPRTVRYLRAVDAHGPPPSDQKCVGIDTLPDMQAADSE